MPKPDPEVKREPEPVTEPETLAELEPEEPDAVTDPTPTKKGACVGSINTACAALLNLWDGGGRGVSEGVEVWFIMLGVGVLLSEEKERNVLCEDEEERNGCEGFERGGWDEGREVNGWKEGLEGEVVLGLARVTVSWDILPEGGWRKERWMNALAWVLFETTEWLLVGREVDIVGCSRSCLELEGPSMFERWGWVLIVIDGIESGVVTALMEPAESELLVLPIALFLPDSVPGLGLEVEMETLLPLLLSVPTSLPSTSDRPGKLKSSSMTSNAAPGFITRVISSKRSSHYAVLA